MLRSRIYFTDPVDKLKLLWVLCTIDWCRENNIKLSNHNLDELLGQKQRRSFNHYLLVLVENDYVAPATLTLTPKGMKVVSNWRKYQDAILDC
jgi:hypothetical protein